MMSWRQWLVLLGIYLVYLLFGGAVFMAIETPLEDIRLQELGNIQQLIYDKLIACNCSQEAEGLFERERIWNEIAEMINQPTLVRGGTVPRKWTLFSSFYVAMTVTSTIGYGHLAPSSPVGRMFCIAYALFGIPLNGMLFATLGDYFGAKLVRRSSNRPSRECAGCLIVLVDVCLYLIPGLVVFLAIPAALFSIMEGWEYIDSFYFAFITLSTIGFGDLVAGQTHIGRWAWFYHLLIFAWIFFGLGYLVMVINIITKGFRSRPVVSLEKKMAAHIRATRTKMAKDAQLLRQLVNQIRILKIKPVYKSDNGEMRRAGSQPTSFSDEEAFYNDLRNRQDAAGCRTGIKGFASDTALDIIDKRATFRNVDMSKPGQAAEDDQWKLLRRMKGIGRIQSALNDTWDCLGS